MSTSLHETLARVESHIVAGDANAAIDLLHEIQEAYHLDDATSPREIQTIFSGLDQARAELVRVETLYQTTDAARLQPPFWEEVTSHLATAEAALQTTQDRLQSSIIATLALLHERKEELAQALVRFQALSGATDAASMAQLSKDVVALQRFEEDHHDDPALAMLANNLTQKLQRPLHAMVRERLQDAQSKIWEADFTQAQEILHQLQQVKGLSGHVQTELEQALIRLEIWKYFVSQIKRADAEHQNTSHRRALETYQSAFHAIIKGDSGLPASLKVRLHRLIVDHRSIDVFNEESKRTFDSLRDDIIDIGDEELVYLLFNSLQQWRGVARKMHLRDLISSFITHGQYSDAYRLARDELRMFPDDESVIKNAVFVREKIEENLRNSVNKRLERAKRLIDERDYEAAKGQLQEIERKIIGPVEEEFPEIITEELQDLRSEARELLTRAEQLPTLSPQLEPLVHEALAAVYETDGDAVRQAIAAAELIDPERLVSHAWILLDGFMALIESKQ